MSTLRKGLILSAYIIDFYVNDMSVLRILKSQNGKGGYLKKKKKKLSIFLKESLDVTSKGWEEELALLWNLTFFLAVENPLIWIFKSKKKYSVWVLKITHRQQGIN